MVRANLEGINTVKKRQKDGSVKIHYYHRATKRPLRGSPGSPEFLHDYALAEQSQVAQRTGTLGGLIRDFTLSPEFGKRAESTQKEYRRMLSKAETKFGTEPIVNVDKLTYAANRKAIKAWGGNAQHHFAQVDITNTTAIAGLLGHYSPRAILHFAAESHVDRSIDDPSAFMTTNVMGTFNLLECARQFYSELPLRDRSRFRFLHVSTDEVFGQLTADEPPTTEARAYAPNSPYSASKAASDHLVRAYYQTYGLPTITSHCSNNYGPMQYPEKLIPVVIARACARQPIPVYGNGSNIRDWLHVQDHCAALGKILDGGTPGESYNVGSNTEVSNIDLVRQLCEIIDQMLPEADQPSRASLITFVEDRPGHDRRYALDASKLRTQLGWEPRHHLDSGLRQTVAWYLENFDWLSQNASVRNGNH